MATLSAQQIIADSKLLVVKIGSSLLIDEAGEVRASWLATLVDDIATLHQDKQILLVSSGAIGLGRNVLGKQKGKLKLEESQAAAAAGQIHLSSLWYQALNKKNIPCAQVLLTYGDTEERRRYLNARSTLMTLLELGAIPLINENDTVATDEIRYGDNDRLAARVANMVGAKCLILLSSVEGLLDLEKNKLITTIDKITPEIEALASAESSALGKGGMSAKLAAAAIAGQGGCHMVIAQGTNAHPLKALSEGGACSVFPSTTTPQAARKTWIGGALKPQGVLVVDEGAATALTQGKSLLPAGVRAVEGSFMRGDLVAIKNQQGEELARGLCAYGREDAEKISGHKSDEIEEILGYRGRQAMVHRDDLVLRDKHG